MASSAYLTLVANDPVHRKTAAGVEELIQAQVMAVRIACEQITGPALERLIDSVDRACCLPPRPAWAAKTAAQAEIFRLLAEVASGTAAAREHIHQARLIRDLMRTVGPAANGMITSSRRRLLGHLRAGDADGAGLEMETHLRALHYMWRLASHPAASAHL